MRNVPQQGPMGCGVACVAMVIGCTYERSRRYFVRLPGNDIERGYCCWELVWALAAAGLRFRKRTFGARTVDARLKSVPVGAIVRVRRWPGDRWLHYVVKSKTGWRDPMDSGGHSKRAKWTGSCRRGQLLREWPRGWRPLSAIVPIG